MKTSNLLGFISHPFPSLTVKGSRVSISPRTFAYNPKDYNCIYYYCNCNHSPTAAIYITTVFQDTLTYVWDNNSIP
jgi:hypothetical protein